MNCAHFLDECVIVLDKNRFILTWLKYQNVRAVAARLIHGRQADCVRSVSERSPFSAPCPAGRMAPRLPLLRPLVITN